MAAAVSILILLRFHVQKRQLVNLQEHDDYQLEDSSSPSPPVYPGMSSAAPPVYCDAINDVILLKGMVYSVCVCTFRKLIL